MSEALTLEQLLKEVDVPPHMINLWTKKFPIFSPQRNGDGKLCFKMRDIAFVKGLKHLLIHENETIKNVQGMLNEKGLSYILDIGKNPENYKNQNANNRAIFANSLSTKSKLSLSEAHKEIAKKAFNNLNSIFTKEKNTPSDTKTELRAETISESSAQQSQNSETITTTTDTASIEIPAQISEITVQPSDDIDTPPPSFEENWRTLMEKKGKATPIEQMRERPEMIVNDDNLSDVWFVDDEINLFDDETADIADILPVVTQKAPHSPRLKNIPATSVPVSVPVPQGLTIEQTEKIRHLIAKLDIMRNEMTSTSMVITKTLKAFGYSSFDNAYDKFDEKSVY